jgi:hypothetical protein
VITLTLKAFCGFDAEGKEKYKETTYTAPTPTIRTVRIALEISKGLNPDGITLGELDTIINFVVDMFGKQFTADDILDGMPAEKLFSLFDIVKAVMDGTHEHIDAIPNVVAAAES